MSEAPGIANLSAVAQESVNRGARVQERDAQTGKSRSHGLDNTLSETFPCSDPLSSIPNPDSYPVELSAAERI